MSGLSNVMPKRGGKERESEPRSRQAIYFGRAEREIMRSGGYSWVGDIRARVALAKNTSRTEGEFRVALAKLGISVEDNSEKARRDDWIFALADDPAKRVSGERLGFTCATASSAKGHTSPKPALPLRSARGPQMPLR